MAQSDFKFINTDKGSLWFYALHYNGVFGSGTSTSINLDNVTVDGVSINAPQPPYAYIYDNNILKHSNNVTVGRFEFAVDSSSYLRITARTGYWVILAHFKQPNGNYYDYNGSINNSDPINALLLVVDNNGTYALMEWSRPSIPSEFTMATEPSADVLGMLSYSQLRFGGTTNVYPIHSDYIENKPIPPTDPYTPDPDGPDGPSEPGGGEGDRDDVDVPVPIPGLPPISAADTGFVTLFNPSSAQIKSLANYMWSSNFDIATFKNIVANPMECILGLSIIPFTPGHAGQGSVKVGNIDSQLFFPIVDNQFVEIDCGTIQVAEYWGSYLDYSPYTKISLYLPYIGIVPLDIDEVQGKSLTVKYHVDVLSGACIAYLLCGTSVLYSYIGQCSCNVPITSNDFTNTVNGVLGIAGNIGSLVALGGSSAPMATGTAIKTAASMASNAINMLKPNVQKSGAMAGTGGLMGTQYPYIIKQRPRQSVPAGQNTFKGYPSNIAVKLGDLSGYTEVDEVHLDGIPATDAEMNEILQLLSEGVYI